MSIQRFAIAAGLFVAVAGSARAEELAEAPLASCIASAVNAWAEAGLLDELATAAEMQAAARPEDSPTGTSQVTAADPRQLLADFALQMLDIRYRRGGRVPATGFDCSGFVHYVFTQVLGVDLPANSASQFSSGSRIGKADLLKGDLVFFHMHGKRVSHVGIYLGDGRFIHSPTTGQRVRVDKLDTPYWARRFAGARRPDALT